MKIMELFELYPYEELDENKIFKLTEFLTKTLTVSGCEKNGMLMISCYSISNGNLIGKNYMNDSFNLKKIIQVQLNGLALS